MGDTRFVLGALEQIMLGRSHEAHVAIYSTEARSDAFATSHEPIGEDGSIQK